MNALQERLKEPEAAASQTPVPTIWGWLSMIVLAGYLLFNHGCHAEVDDEPGLLPDAGQHSSHDAR